MRFLIVLVTAIAAGLAVALIIRFTRGSGAHGSDPAPQEPRKMSVEEKTKRMAAAIAKAEGFYVAGSLAERANNPGNLKLGDRGSGTIHGKTIFSSVIEGWNALERQIDLMRTGQSAFYNASMTIHQIAVIYTGGDKPDAWARIVAGDLGITTATTLAAYFAA